MNEKPNGNGRARAYRHALRHAEAYKLMLYRCVAIKTPVIDGSAEIDIACSSEEWLWNSRDGVVPFVVECSKCGKPNMQHVEWERDIFAPRFKPLAGMRFFRDGTNQEARTYLGDRWERFQEDEGFKEHYPDKEAFVVKLLKEDFLPGWPELEIVT